MHVHIQHKNTRDKSEQTIVVINTIGYTRYMYLYTFKLVENLSMNNLLPTHLHVHTTHIYKNLKQLNESYTFYRVIYVR
jgi:hypothetical protein